VHAPAAATEYARRLAQRGIPLAALLRAYRVGHARLFGRLLNELAEQTNDAEMLSTTALSMSRVVAEYIDQTSEGISSPTSRRRRTGYASGAPHGPPGSATCCRVSASM
jgi:hypothetical protein